MRIGSEESALDRRVRVVQHFIAELRGPQCCGTVRAILDNLDDDADGLRTILYM